MKILTCIARIEAKEGFQNKVATELSKLLQPTRSEKGCIDYDMHIDNENNHVFMFHETWQTEYDLDQHLESEHIKHCFAEIEQHLATVEISRLTKVIV